MPPPFGDKNASAGLLATTILVTVLSVVLVTLRFGTRIWIVKRLGHPIGTALVVVQLSYGFGRPAYYLSPHQFREFSKYAYGEWLQTFATLTFTKVSICLFLLRITVTKASIRPLQAAVIILIVSNIVLSLVWIFQCTPYVDKAWDDKKPGKCFSKGQLERIIISQALISIISDFFLSAFPILILRKVQISFRSKIGLCLLMGLGVITGSLSIVRTILNWQNETDDPTWASIPNWYWRSWEVFFGIAAACIPTLRPGYKWLVSKIRARFTKLASGDSKPVVGVKWTPPEAVCALQVFEEADDSNLNDGADMEHYPPGDQEQERYPRDQFGNERKEGLHIPGDLSTHRPGHFKRLDSEAKVGGGLGAEEVEDRI
ncbi:hypothetical protein HO133_003885 [Letharia lupina]|uniref:Rhodopsin domain-containing protein n=1 Tax=Letharia lupina TaxID=560253 RepID=A0A8H6CAW2_9LECA|nr:uncharacterized protein HO133_003885 [Letharia lupina]KAF6220060.1 hypothetical protein HO133_003885 [Letharia lupina]